MALCGCGCGGEAEPGNRYIRGHNLRGIKASKETKQKRKETKRINKEIKEGKRSAPKLPFCACGCGGRVTKPGNKYIAGHHLRGKKPWNYGETKETDDRVKKYGEKGGKTLKAFYATDEGKGYAKERSENLKVFYQTEEGKEVAKEHSIFLKSFFETEEGQKWLDDNWRGENSPIYGKESWKKGLTKEIDESIKRGGEKLSITKKEFFASEEGQEWIKKHMCGKYLTDDHKQKISETRIEKFANGELKSWNEGLTKKTSESVLRGAEALSISKQEFFQTDKGQEWIDENMRGENAPMYGKDAWNKGKTKETEKGLMRISESKKGDKNPAKRPEVRQKLRDAALGRISWRRGLTKENDKRVRIAGEKGSITKKEFFATEEGQQWLDENRRGENSPCFGKESWCKGKTKETDERLEKLGKKSSKTKKEFFATEEGQEWIDKHMRGENSPMFGVHRCGEDAPMYGKDAWNKGLTKETDDRVKEIAENVSKGLKKFFASEEGQKYIKEHMCGENHPMYGKEAWCRGETKETNKSLKKQSEKQLKNWQDPEFIKKMVNSWYRSGQTKPEKGIDGIVQILYPNEYKFNGNFELGITIGGKIPDFVNVNGKKKAIDVFGDWCHRDEDPQIRIDLFKKYGWDLLVIWQHELEDKDTVIQKIVKFHGVKSDFILTQKTLDMWINKKEKKED